MDDMLIHELRMERKRRRSSARRHPQHDPSWIVFRAGRHCARLPFAEAQDGWGYVLDVTSNGFRADRERDAIVITWAPSSNAGEVAS